MKNNPASASSSSCASLSDTARPRNDGHEKSAGRGKCAKCSAAHFSFVSFFVHRRGTRNALIEIDARAAARLWAFPEVQLRFMAVFEERFALDDGIIALSDGASSFMDFWEKI